MTQTTIQKSAHQGQQAAANTADRSAEREMMELIKRNTNYPLEFIEMTRLTIAPDLTMSELALFLYTAKRMGLDPLAKQIYAWIVEQTYESGRTVRRLVIVTAIDGYRSNAEQSGKYDGQDDAVYTYYDKNLEHTFPDEARVAVYRKDVSRPFIGVARWKEYYPKQSKRRTKWDDMPHTMLAKCAEAVAMRKAFPKNLSGVYIPEELDQNPDVGIEAPELKNVTPMGAEPHEVEEAATKKRNVPKITDEQIATIIDACETHIELKPVLDEFLKEIGVAVLSDLDKEQADRAMTKIGLVLASNIGRQKAEHGKSWMPD